MLVTILLLLLTLLVVPLVSFYFGTPLTDLQSDILSHMQLTVGVVIAFCFVVGEMTRNYSQTDKLWSLVPILYAWQMSGMADFPPRMVLMSCLVTAWGIRLTYNFSRRGAYSWKFWEGEEDYRWKLLRQRPGFSNRWVWMLFNLFFISAYQNILIFLFVLPLLTALGEQAPPSVTLPDLLLAALFLACVVLEFIADQQQYEFQTEKHRRLRNNEPLGEYAAGFLSTGLWSRVRHPNYAMEQAAWIVFYGFSVVSTGEWINWAMPGCLLLILLFRGSSDFSESISAKKYPDYKNYQRQVPRFIPRLLRRNISRA